MLCTLGGRFPRARAEPPREDRSAGSHRLRFSRWSRHLPFRSLKVVVLFTCDAITLSVNVRIFSIVFVL